jgi:ionotropic kainate glutamate receptor 2
MTGLFQVEYRGITGPVQFREGRRTNIKFDLLKLKSHALVKVGEWTPRNGVNITDSVAFFDTGIMNVTLVVTTNLVSERKFSFIFKHTHARIHTFA